jgi:hypothetical protein
VIGQVNHGKAGVGRALLGDVLAGEEGRAGDVFGCGDTQETGYLLTGREATKLLSRDDKAPPATEKIGSNVSRSYCRVS